MSHLGTGGSSTREDMRARWVKLLPCQKPSQMQPPFPALMYPSLCPDCILHTLNVSRLKYHQTDQQGIIR
jgi:hypothetical protein